MPIFATWLLSCRIAASAHFHCYFCSLISNDRLFHSQSVPFNVLEVKTTGSDALHRDDYFSSPANQTEPAPGGGHTQLHPKPGGGYIK